MSDDSVLFTAVYDDVNDALADLDAVQRLHEAGTIGNYDAAVIDNQDGTPRIVRRMDHPAARLLPELVGLGALPRKDLKEAAGELTAGQAGLVVLGEPTVDKWVKRSVRATATTRTRWFAADADRLADEILDALRR